MALRGARWLILLVLLLALVGSCSSVGSCVSLMRASFLEEMDLHDHVEVTDHFSVRWKGLVYLVVLTGPAGDGPHATGVWVTDATPSIELEPGSRPTILPLNEDAAHFTDIVQIGDRGSLQEVYEVAGDPRALPHAEGCPDRMRV